jgi:archaellum biogenesis protein FlaJ (TadC family)
MSIEQLVAIAAAIMSLVFMYAPKLKSWYESKSPTEKRQIMAVWLFIVTASLFGLSCLPVASDFLMRFGIMIACDLKSATDLLYLYMLAIAVNQGVFMLTPKRPKLAG